MQVQFWGAARTVTGSMHLVEFQGKKLLLDCGLYQGRRKEAFKRNREMPIVGRDIDAVVLSHAHVDHCGNLPTLVRTGFKGKIFATTATRNLCVHLLLDAAHIQESDVKYVNKKRAKKNQTLFEPLYVHDDAIRTLNCYETVEFEESFEPVPGVQCRFLTAGHMLGAGHVELSLKPENGKPTRLVFSGDIGRPGVPILKDPTIPEGADYLIMEATYGNREHIAGRDADEVLLHAVEKTWDSQGKLIVPAFSVGRTQEVVYRLNNLSEAGKLPPIPVFVDSPLAADAHTVFQQHYDYFDEEFARKITSEEDNDPLSFPRLHIIRKVQHSKELNKSKEPCIIISASGMCEAGRILHHLKNNIEKPNTTILFTGYQAPYTLGRRIQDGEKEIRIFGEPYQMNAQSLKLPSSSGHADQSELLDWAKGVAEKGNIKKVALVHCELESAEAFAEKLMLEKIGPVIIPERGETMSLTE